MPFSFQPNITGTEGGAQVAQPVSITAGLGASAQGLVSRATSSGKSFLEIILFVVFGLSILTVVILLGYKFFLSSQIESKKAELNAYEARLAGYPVEEMRKLSSRMKVVNQLIREHPSVQVAFLIIEASVENMVTFTKFDLRYSESARSYQLVLSGTAPNYKSVAQQLDALRTKPYSTYIPKFTLDNILPDANGKVVFSLTMPVTITGIVPETFSVMDGVVKPEPPQAVLPPESEATSTQPSAL